MFFSRAQSAAWWFRQVAGVDGDKTIVELVELLVSYFIVFSRLTVAQVSFCGLTKGITPKICRLCVCVIINKCSFEAFMCLDLILER